MAKLSTAFSTLLLLFISGTLMMADILAAESCFEDMGSCDGGCFNRCYDAHPGSRASCVGATVCKCVFNCIKCVQSLGGGGCNPPECNSKCVAKYPNQGSFGYCDRIAPALPVTCYCNHNC